MSHVCVPPTILCPHKKCSQPRATLVPDDPALLAIQASGTHAPQAYIQVEQQYTLNHCYPAMEGKEAGASPGFAWPASLA